MMKGCHYDSRFLRRHLKPHVYAIQESGELTADALGRLGKQESTARALLDGFKNAKEYGSILQPKVTLAELDALQEQLREVDGASDMGSLPDQLVAGQIVNVLYPLIEQARMLVQKYDVVVTNPPYMGGSGMNARLSDYVKKYYPDSKSDLFAVFIERCAQMDKRGGYQAMITQHAWMFLSSFEKLRAKLQLIDTVNMAHLGARGFDEIGGEVVQTTSFVMRSSHTKGYKGTYCRLIDGDSEKAKAEMFVSGENRYVAEQDNFSKIPGSPVAYWVAVSLFSKFQEGKAFVKYSKACSGLKTGDNDTFLRQWFEVQKSSIKFDCASVETAKASGAKWFPYNKGGEYRKWYGNRDLIVNFQNDGEEIRKQKEKGISIRITSYEKYFQEGITWTGLTSGQNTYRYCPKGTIFDSNKGPMFFNEGHNLIKYFMALFNSKPAQYILDVLNPSMSLQNGDMEKFPVIVRYKENVESIVDECIDEAKSDWDSFETSWDFKRHPLV